jgi:pimeloyl-ACP methyl ester carboxylesterase
LCFLGSDTYTQVLSRKTDDRLPHGIARRNIGALQACGRLSMRYSANLRALLFGALAGLGLSLSAAHADPVQYRYATADGIRIFYREAGNPQSPTILLLHGFPSSSFMFRDLIPLLAGQFHLVAPDYPGMGYSDAPPATQFTPTFDSLANVMEDFAAQLHLSRFILYMQDFGGPVGMRIALKYPDRIEGLIIQNSPVSLDGWNPARLKAVQDNAGPNTPAKRAAAEARVVEATAIQLHQAGAAHPDQLNPDSWADDAFALSDPEKKRIMTDLQLDIPANLAAYPAWQDYIRSRKPRTLVVWGQNDPIFAAAGAETVKTLNPAAEVHLYNTGHFALNENSADIAAAIRQFFSQ